MKKISQTVFSKYLTSCGKWANKQVAFLFILAFCFIAGNAMAQPTFSKTFSPSTIGPGSVSTLTYVINNGSPSPVTDLSFTNTLPVAVTIATPAMASTTCDLNAGGILSAPNGGSTITLSDARLAGNSSCTVTISVTASTPGVHTNPAVTLYSSAGSSMSLSADLTVATDRPGFSKTFANNNIDLKETTTLTYTIDNTANASQVSNMAFTDNLPIGIKVAAVPNIVSDCTSPLITAVPGGGSISLSPPFFGGSSVAAGASCTISVEVAGAAVGTWPSTTGDLSVFNINTVSAGKATSELTVTRGDIHIVKEFKNPNPVPPGGTVDLEFTITNYSRDFDATDIEFTDDLSTALSGLVATGLPLTNLCGSGSSISGTSNLSFTGGNIASNGGSCTFTITCAVPPSATPGVYLNTTGAVTGMVDGSLVTGNEASAKLFVQAVPTFSKEFTNDPVTPGETVTLSFTIGNPSLTSGMTDISFIDELTTFLPFPINATLPSNPCGAGSSLSLIGLGTKREGLFLAGGSLDATPSTTDSCTFEVGIVIPADFPNGVYTNTTEPITATVDGAPAIGPAASDDLVVVAGPSLIKSFTDDPVAPSGTVTLEFTLVHSIGAPDDATGITFTDDLNSMGLAGLTANLPTTPDPPCGAGSTLTGSAGDTFLTLSGGTLSPGSSCTFSVTLDIPASTAPGTYTNTTSSVTSTVSGLNVTSPAASDDLKVAALVFSKEFLDDELIPGEATTLRFTIQNVHPTDDATSLFFTDNLAAEISGFAATGSPTSDDCGGSLSGTTLLNYSGGSVLAGQSCTIDVPVLLPATAANGNYTNVTSILSANQGGGSVFVDPAVASFSVNDEFIFLTKEFTNDPVGAGDPVTLKFTLTNLDPDQAISGIDFSDDLDATLSGLIFDSGLSNDCGGMGSGQGTGTFSYSGGSLAPGGTCTIEIELDVPAGAATGIYPNTTSAPTGTLDGLAVTGNEASDNLRVQDILDFTKTFDGPAVAGDTAILTFTISNPGTSTVGNIRFTDDLDAMLSGAVAVELPSTPCGTSSTISGTSFLDFTGGEIAAMDMCSFDVKVVIPCDATTDTYSNTSSQLTYGAGQSSNPATADISVTAAAAASFTRPPDATIYMDANCNFDASVSETGDVTNETHACCTGLEATYTDVFSLNGCNGTGTIQRTWSLTDCNSLMSPTQVQTITVLDTTPPVLVCKNITVNLNANRQYNLTASEVYDAANSGDNCSNAISSLSVSHSLLDCDDLGDVTVTVTGKDACNNTGSCTATVTVDDPIYPCCPPTNIIYVNENTPNDDNGWEWASAFASLQDALELAAFCPNVTEIWVAKGTYYPDDGILHTPGDRKAFFVLQNGIAIIGGLNGTEPMGYDMSARDIGLNATTLSGDIGTPSDSTDNSYHVVRNGAGIGATATLDGFTVTGGNANMVLFNTAGAGMLNEAASPTIRYCQFYRNTALSRGGGVYNDAASSPSVKHCSFVQNKAMNGGALANAGASNPTVDSTFFIGNMSVSNGGAIYNNASSPTFNHCFLESNQTSGSGAGMANFAASSPVIRNCGFEGNSAESFGGGVYCTATSSPAITNVVFLNNSASLGGGVYSTTASAPKMTNCSFHGNTAVHGGSIANQQSAPIVINSILWGNSKGTDGTSIENINGTTQVSYSIVEKASGTYPGTGNLNADPLFVGPMDLQLQPCSPAVNVGNNAANSLTSDLLGNTRIIGGTIDLGAFESQLDISVPNTWTGSGDGANWHDAANWDAGVIPVKCQNVIIPTGNNVTILAGNKGYGATLEVQPGAALTTDPTGELCVEKK